MRGCALLALVASTTLVAGHVAHADELPVPAPVSEPAPPPVPATPSPVVCADDELVARLVPLLRAERFADVHHAAVAARVLCRAALDGTRLVDSIALLRLEDRPVAYAELSALASSRVGETARVVLGWAYRADGDTQASDGVLAQIPPLRAAAIRAVTSLGDGDAFVRHVTPLPAELRTAALALHARYEDAHERSPALAGVLSALVPGSGQLYAGSLQAAAVTFVLNALFISATVELVRREDYFTAAAAGTAASFFYVGGVMNAVDLARRRNERAREPVAAELERLLVPELTGGR